MSRGYRKSDHDSTSMMLAACTKNDSNSMETNHGCWMLSTLLIPSYCQCKMGDVHTILKSAIGSIKHQNQLWTKINVCSPPGNSVFLGMILQPTAKAKDHDEYPVFNIPATFYSSYPTLLGRIWSPGLLATSWLGLGGGRR